MEPPPQLLLLDFVQCVLRRPVLYTEQGTYYEAVAFLKGYLSNVPGQHFNDAPWFEFLDWLRERQKYGEGRILIQFRETHPDDASALQALEKLYTEFQGTLPAENSETLPYSGAP